MTTGLPAFINYVAICYIIWIPTPCFGRTSTVPTSFEKGFFSTFTLTVTRLYMASTSLGSTSDARLVGMMYV